MLHWLRDRRRKQVLEHQFPRAWQAILAREVRHYSCLDPEEQHLLEQLVQVFLAEKRFEGCSGLEITDEIRVVIAAQACLLVLGIEHDLYPDLLSILVYPSTVVVPPPRTGVFTRSPLVIEEQDTAIYGQAMLHGPVVLVWDEVARGARHPETGHNVVYHEFAHLLDMGSGAANGTPRLHSREEYREWADVLTREFEALRRDAARGKKSFLDTYGALNEAEFFAVATEYFFDRPLKMEKNHTALYRVLAGYYRQDPAARQRKARAENRC